MRAVHDPDQLLPPADAAERCDEADSAADIDEELLPSHTTEHVSWGLVSPEIKDFVVPKGCSVRHSLNMKSGIMNPKVTGVLPTGQTWHVGSEMQESYSKSYDPHATDHAIETNVHGKPARITQWRAEKIICDWLNEWWYSIG